MRKTLILAAIAGMMMTGAAPAEDTPAAAAAPAAEAAAATHFSTDASTIGDLLANPAANEVLQRHIPEVVSSPQISMASGMTLKQIQAYAPNITDEKLAQIDADLQTLH